MPRPIEIARSRIVALQREVAELQRFIALYEHLESGTNPDHPETSQDEGSELTGKLSTGKFLGENAREKSYRRSPRPNELADIVERVIREVGQPMTRGQIVEALERRDVEIPAQDKQRYVGTIAWRQKARFVNIEGLGYWLRGEPVPRPIGASESDSRDPDLLFEAERERRLLEP